MKETSQHLQIYFEIALSIGNSLDLSVMLKQCLSTYLRLLNCSGGLVLQTSFDGDTVSYHPICAIPRRYKQNTIIQQALEHIPQGCRQDAWADFAATLPVYGVGEGSRHFHIMGLGDFGLLVLVRSNEALSETVLKSLAPINQKLAVASLSCLQNEQVEGLVAQLKQEAEERQKVQDQLVASKQKYQTIFENIQDVYCEVGHDGRLIEVSPSVYSMFGYTREELIGQSIAALYVHSQERDTLLQVIHQEGRVSDYEVTVRNKQGDHRRCSINSVKQKAALGGESKLIGSIRDISKRKATEINLKRVKEKAVNSAVALKKANNEMLKLHRAIEQSPTVVLITDQSGCIEYVNPKFSKLTGYSVEEAIGRKPSILKSGHQEEVLYKELWDTITSGKTWEGELLNKAKDGHLFWEQAFISPVKDNTGRITHFIAIKEDISWRKAAEAELKQAQQEIKAANAARSQFLANMSHEIRTPLNGVIGMTALMLDTKLNEEQQDIAQTIRISADSLMAAVNNILDYAKVMAGQLDLENVAMQLDTVLDDVVSIMQPQIGDKSLQLYHNIAMDVPLELSGDVGRLKQVMINLVSNAIKFTDEGEVVVRIATTDEDEDQAHFHFSISDTGIGIAPDYQSHIFECFSQNDTGMNRRYGGTGMGLAVSKALVQAMGGDIGFSTQQGRGSIFWFTVKLGIKASGRRYQISQILKHVDNQAVDRSGQRILLVEDNIINQKLTVKILEKIGYSVDVANNGREAVEAVRHTAYHLVLMDVQMPVMDGLAATRTIRRDKGLVNGAPIPIVALTAHAMRGDRQACFEAGMDDYLSKPVNSKQLAITIGHHIDQSKMTAG